MERRTVYLIASLTILLIATCSGFAWMGMRVMSAIVSATGDGLWEVDDPRPARAVVRVTDDTGRPLADVRVEAFAEPPFWGDFESKFGFDPASDPVAALTATTGADGAVTFGEIGSGAWVIAARAPGRATAFANVAGGHAARHDVRLVLGTARTLAGRVSDGSPVAGAVVLACESSNRHFQAQQWLAACRTRTGPDGAFAFDDLPPGVLTLWVAAPGDVPVEAGRVLVPQCTSAELPIPSQRTRAILRPGSVDAVARAARVRSADEDVVRITGIVRASDGSPLGGACVTALHHGEYGSDETLAWTSTTDDGTFSLAGVPPGAEITLSVGARGHLTLKTEWDRADAFAAWAEYRLERGHRIAGTVRAPDGSTPRGVRLLIYRLGEDRATAMNGMSVLWAGTPQWWWKASPVPVAADGSFETTWEWDAGRLVAYAAAEGFAPTVSAPFDVGGATARVDVVLDPGVTLRCRLVEEAGGLPVRRPVRVRPPGFVSVWSATAAEPDADGRFTIEHLPAKPFVLEIGSLRTHEFDGATVTPGPDEIEVRLTKRVRGDASEDER